MFYFRCHDEFGIVSMKRRILCSWSGEGSDLVKTVKRLIKSQAIKNYIISSRTQAQIRLNLQEPVQSKTSVQCLGRFLNRANVNSTGRTLQDSDKCFLHVKHWEKYI